MFAITEAKGINLTLLVYELLSSKGDYAGQIMANRCHGKQENQDTKQKRLAYS